jgi:hypothetical protein
MHFETLLYRTDGPIATVTLNRPPDQRPDPNNVIDPES